VEIEKCFGGLMIISRNCLNDYESGCKKFKNIKIKIVSLYFWLQQMCDIFTAYQL